MEKHTADNVCAICGRAEGKPYEYVLACDHVTKISRGRKKAAEVRHEYSLVEHRTECACDACRKQRKAVELRRIAIMLAVGVALVVACALIISAANAKAQADGSHSFGFWGSIAALAVIPSVIFAVVGFVSIIRCLRSDYGSEALGAHRKAARFLGDPSVLYMTPKEARSKKVIQ